MPLPEAAAFVWLVTKEKNLSRKTDDVMVFVSPQRVSLRPGHITQDSIDGRETILVRFNAGVIVVDSGKVPTFFSVKPRKRCGVISEFATKRDGN